MFYLQPKFNEKEAWEALARESGFAFEPLEIFEPPMNSDAAASQACRRWYRETGLCPSLHGDFIDVNPASGDGEFRALSREKCRRSCRIAKAIGARRVILHGSAFPTLRGGYLENWARVSAAFFEELAEEFDLMICVENSQDVDTTPLKTLMQYVRSDKVRLCLDIGHANYTRLPMETWFGELGPYIAALHLSDNRGGFDDHLPLGDGCVDWAQIDALWRSIGAPPHLTLEVGGLENVKKSVAFLRKYGYFGAAVPREKAPHHPREYSTLPGAQKRTLTMLKSDLRGFTAIAERMRADDLLEMLNHYLGTMTEVILRRGGTIIDFMGDGIFAIFGAPVATGTHASDAVAAALEMQQKMEGINQRNERRGYPKLEMGVGIHTGEVIVGNIGSEQRTKYGVVGSHVNLTDRVESYTVGGQVLISPSTRRAITPPLEITNTLKVYPKGVSQSALLSQVEGIGLPYDVCCHCKYEPLIPLKKPLPFQFRMVEDKHVGKALFHGVITALSATGIRLETFAPVEALDDLQLEIGGRLLGKITAGDGTGWLLRFTSFPPEFDAWFREHYQG